MLLSSLPTSLWELMGENDTAFYCWLPFSNRSTLCSGGRVQSCTRAVLSTQQNSIRPEEFPCTHGRTGAHPPPWISLCHSSLCQEHLSTFVWRTVHTVPPSYLSCLFLSLVYLKSLTDSKSLQLPQWISLRKREEKESTWFINFQNT